MWDKFVQEVVSNLDESGYLRKRESSILELKENFTFKCAGKYLKTLASFANNSGGVILFGVKDSPRIPKGIDVTQFNKLEVEKITEAITTYFAPAFDWDLGSITCQQKEFGYLSVEKSNNKPVICKKNHSKELKEGAIYYRYRGQSKLINYAELKKIHDEIREKEKLLWMKHIQKIAKIGPQNIALIDLVQGILDTDTKKFVIDSNLLKKLKKDIGFIQEGHFSETEGSPVLKVIGEVEGTEALYVGDLDPDKDYPLFTSSLCEQLNQTQYDILAAIWHLNLRHDKKYHLKTKSSSSSDTNKYSKYALLKLKSFFSDAQKMENFPTIKKQYYHAKHNK